MPELTIADALRLAINVLRDSAGAHKMFSGVPLDGQCAKLHADAADTLEESLKDLD